MVNSCFVQHGDARIHYLDSGGDDLGAPIVFVPGMTDVATDYVEVLPLFGRRTLVVEVRGHGASSSPVAGYDLDTIGADVGAAIDAVTTGAVHVMTFSRGTSAALAWALAHPARVRSIAIGDYVPEEKALPSEVCHRLLTGRWRGTPVSERVDMEAGFKTFAAARDQSFWEALARLDLPLLAVRSSERILVDDEAWARYRRLYPGADLVEFGNSPHDIFRPDRGRYPTLVREHVTRAEQ